MAYTEYDLYLNIVRNLLLVFIFCTSALLACGQESTHDIIVSGKAYDAADSLKRLEDLMIINLRTSQGTFGKADGNFRVDIQKTDTILIASTGYVFERITFADSVVKPEYIVTVPLKQLSVTLREVSIFSPRDLQSIYTDIEKLGYNKKDFQLSGVDAFSSPITFLYQEFSQLERLKRHNRERVNNDKRRELLKQLLANYVAADIINLDDYEFDDFIDFADVPEPYMKTASQYDFCMYIKQKFELFALLKKRK